MSNGRNNGRIQPGAATSEQEKRVAGNGDNKKITP